MIRSDAVMHRAGAGRALRWARQLDEMEIPLVVDLLAGGRRVFDDLGEKRVGFELVRGLDDRDVTHLSDQARLLGRA